jgi:hypothetical protein
LVAAGECDLRRGEVAGEAGAHVDDVFAEVAREVVELRDVALVVLDGVKGLAADVFFVGPEGGVGVDGALVFADFLLIDERDELGAEDLEVDALVGREKSGVESVDLVEDSLPMREVGLLLDGVDERKQGGNAVGVVWVFGAALGFAPGVFCVVDGA